MAASGGNTSEKIATDIINLALTIRSEKTKVFISGLTITNDTLRKSVRIQSYSGPHFSALGQNTDNQNNSEYGQFLRSVQSR